MATEQRGKFVLGLQPFDRMPNDWLRMVARVFAAYRKLPLEESIVAYIDGLNLELISGGNPGDHTATVKITPGQAFIDDQFVGFKENSYLTFSMDWMNIGQEYCITLSYRFINQTPPPEPHFSLKDKSLVMYSQEDLCLGYAIKQADGSIVIVDAKIPWYKEMVETMVGDTEVDPEIDLPYLIRINEPGSENPGVIYDKDRAQTIDIGWAIDFHDEVGNNVDYNVRLHTPRNGSDDLYINNRKIFTYLDQNDPNFNEDPNDPTDGQLPFHHNITIIDDESLDANGDPLYPLSDSGKGCYSIKTIPLDPNDQTRGATFCFNRDDISATIKNSTDFGNDAGTINELTLTQDVDLVTINGQPIWHWGNLESSGKSIYFLGIYSDADPDDFPTERLDGTPLQNGDTLYNDNYQAFFYWDTNSWRRVGITESSKQYEFVAIEGQTGVQCEYNVNFVMVSVSGVVLSRADYVANDGHNIIFNRELQEGEVVTIHTVIGGQNIGISMNEIADVSIINIQEGDVLSYQQEGQPGNYVWKNGPVSVSKLQDVGNVIDGNISENDVLVYDSINDFWTNRPYPTYRVGDLNDVVLNNVQEGDIIQVQINPTTGLQEWVNKSFYDSIPTDLGFPVGTVLMWATDTPPLGFLECNGALVSRNAYAKLFNIIGERFGVGDGSTTFRLPDLRGEFVRGWDHGRGIDPNRDLGTSQTDTIKNITGEIGHPNTGAYNALLLQDNVPSSGAFNTIEGQYKYDEANGSVGNYTGRLEFDASRSVPTSNEVRPKNVALMYIIKY